MEINVFLNNIKQDFIESCNLYHPKQIGNSITIYKEGEEIPDLDDFQLAIIGVEEDRNSFNNHGCKEGPNNIRKSLYQLFNHWNDLKIIDLGNIKTGFEVEDTYFALNKVFTTLMKYSIIPIILGGSQDLTYPIYQVYENTGKLQSIKYISSINIRIAHEIIGAANSIIKYISTKEKVCNTLIISPPGMGKTTLLRDIIRQISNLYTVKVGDMLYGCRARGKFRKNNRYNVFVIKRIVI